LACGAAETGGAALKAVATARKTGAIANFIANLPVLQDRRTVGTLQRRCAKLLLASARPISEDKGGNFMSAKFWAREAPRFRPRQGEQHARIS
jgi:hypothetical protein